MGRHFVTIRRGVAVDTTEEDQGKIVPIVSRVVEGLLGTRHGRKFLDEFKPEKCGINGGTLFRDATVVFKRPSEFKKTQMKSVAECGHLRYQSSGGTVQFTDDAQKPAHIFIFCPGEQIPAKFGTDALAGVPIDAHGGFKYFGNDESLENVIMHEMIHAYHYVVGNPELYNDADDERRAVGLDNYKNLDLYPYCENSLRYAMGMPIRTTYPLFKIDDPSAATFNWKGPGPQPIVPFH